MLTTARKARFLLKQGKAKIVGYKPFTIQLNYATGEAKQEVIIGVKQGAKNVGIAVVSQDKVLAKGEITLRQEVSSLLLARAVLRRVRRNRNTRYRKARFLNRTSSKKQGWLPPSTKGKLNANFAWIDKFSDLVPNPKLRIQVAKFDIAKLINPEIQGIDYQKGQTYGFEDVRYFVFARDNYTCQICKKKNKILQTHHIVYRSEGGTDRADNLLTVCTDCHTADNHKEGGALYEWRKNGNKLNQYKEPTFMNIMRVMIFKKYPNAEITYGSETLRKRKELVLDKTNYNDAIAISGINIIKENPKDYFMIKQFRKKKRSLHEANPAKFKKKVNVEQIRHNKNTKLVKTKKNGITYLNDEVICYGKRGWISGFSGNYQCYVVNIGGKYIYNPNKKHKLVSISGLKRLSHNNNWNYVLVGGHSSPSLEEGDF